MSEHDRELELDAASEDELAAAAAFAQMLDGADAGAAAHPDDERRELAEVALMIRASHNEQALTAQRRDALLDAAFAEAQVAPATISAAAPAVVKPVVDELAARREKQSARRVSRMRRMGPVLALAAAVLLVVGVSLTLRRAGDRAASSGAAVSRHAAVSGANAPRLAKAATARTRAVASAGAKLPAALLSRPSDDLIGKPIRDRAGAARRLDRVFEDRLAGYRQLALARRSP